MNLEINRWIERYKGSISNEITWLIRSRGRKTRTESDTTSSGCWTVAYFSLRRHGGEADLEGRWKHCVKVPVRHSSGNAPQFNGFMELQITYCLIPFVRHSWKRQNYRNQEQITGHQGLGGEEGCDYRRTAGGSLGDDEAVLYPDCGSGTINPYNFTVLI